MTLTHIRCPYCNGKNVEEQSTYTIKCGVPRTMYYCSSCERSFSETIDLQVCFWKWLLLDSRVVDVLRLSNLMLVTLASLKPFFFNGLKKALHFPDNVGA